MSTQQPRQVRPLASEPVDRGLHSPYLRADEAAIYLKFASVGALYKAIEVEGIPVCRRGRTLLFRRDHLDRWLAGESRDVLMREARAREHSERVASPFSVVKGASGAVTSGAK